MFDYFKNFKKYAFRLELLQKYDVDSETEEFKVFLKTGKIKSGNKPSEWHNIIKAAIKRNAQFRRVHVIEEPISDYLNFEFEGYKSNIGAGDEVFILKKETFDKINSGINFDYWLFDDEIVLKMNYDLDGKFLGFDKITASIKQFIELKDRLLAVAIPLDKYL